MPRNISVREIREALYRAAGGPNSTGDGSSSTLMLGRWFHEVFAALFSADSKLNWETALADVPHGADEWAKRMEEHVYRRIIGAKLSAHQSQLQCQGDAVAALWSAIRALCRWLADILIDARGRSEKFYVAPEHELTWELRETNWCDSVIVSGIADAVFRRLPDNRWCAIELKLGKTAPEADLGQACLYHQMLSASSGKRGGDLALLSFQPQCHEKIFHATDLAAASAALIHLIGELAGVVIIPTHVVITSAATTREATPPPPVTPSLPPPPQVDNTAAYEELGKRLVKIFSEYNAPVRLISPHVVGPTFIRYFVTPEKGVPIKRVTALAQDVQGRLQLSAEPFIGLSNGRTTVDIQRPDRQVLKFADIRTQLGTRDPLFGSSRVPVGVDLEGRLHCADLATPEHSHILVAGVSGSGKSEWLRCAIAGMIALNTPATLRFVLIDPKRNAFNALKGSPFLFNTKALVYPDETDVNDVLDDLIEEMQSRYRELEKHSADNLKELVKKTSQPVARIVCVCDEYADLISHGKKERRAIEERLQRLGNKARAAGIHLILATQNPSREVVKGALDTNMPCRVGLKTSKMMESKMLLNQSGAENLLGHGDLLFKDIGDARRYQAPLLSESDRRELFAT